ncbi:hypothetical protein DPEC_G00006440 [Dallia pectoralis]|uniref:Uncharacterized protein n=1 Tax=Dallia pectoralis TaxID=75939 RepID=A0ACC2HK09_DALPE|nr:hypothetical protein DPEC_G00006440 [Dallia pectoralis]
MADHVPVQRRRPYPGHQHHQAQLQPGNQGEGGGVAVQVPVLTHHVVAQLLIHLPRRASVVGEVAPLAAEQRSQHGLQGVLLEEGSPVSPQEHHGQFSHVSRRRVHLASWLIPSQVVEGCRLAVAVHAHRHLALNSRSDVEACVLHPQRIQDVGGHPAPVVRFSKIRSQDIS